MKGQTNSFVLGNRLQRLLRRKMMEAELLLWKRLRGRQLQGLKFRRQHPFDDFVLDFVCLEAKLIIEVDGGQHNESGEDALRDQRLEQAGFRVMRFWNNQVLNEIESIVEAIWLELEKMTASCRTHPHPDLPPEGEGRIASPLEEEGTIAPPPSRGRMGGGWGDSLSLQEEVTDSKENHVE